jgi:hypothetical protein
MIMPHSTRLLPAYQVPLAQPFQMSAAVATVSAVIPSSQQQLLMAVVYAPVYLLP